MNTGKKFILNTKRLKTISKIVKKTITKKTTSTTTKHYPIINEKGDVIDDGY